MQIETETEEYAMSNWDTLKHSCEDCTACPLHATRTNCVFGVGNPESKLMFVGEAPGEQEDLSGIPFVGRAGKLLDKYLEYVDIPREDVYIANILKCRPPQNRDPQESEQDLCIDYLREQVRIIRPKMIVCLGRIAAMRLIKPDYKITREHGIWVQKGAFEMTAVYHPSLLLRGNTTYKEQMLTDMKVVAEKYRKYKNL